MTHDPLADWFGREAPALPRDEAPLDPPEPAPGTPPGPWADNDDRDDGAAAPRRRLLFALAAVPWVAVAILVVALTRPGAAPGVVAPAHEAASPEWAPAPTSPDVPPAAVDAPPPSGPRAPQSPQEAQGASAVLHVRAAASTGAGADPVRYVDTAVVERVEHHGEVAVVTVLAMVLEGSAERWTSAVPRRYAVALLGGRPLADPWALPSPELAHEAVSWDPLDDTELAAVALEALATAGYDVPAPPALAGSSELPDLLRATFDGTAPGERAPAGHTVLLRRDGTALGVLGHTHHGHDLTIPTPEEMP
jgi:hypothetical protein